MKRRITATICICIVISLLLIAHFSSPYRIGNDIGEMRELIKENNDVVYNGFLIHRSKAGIVEIFKTGYSTENSGELLAVSSLSFDKIKSHFTMLSVYKGMTLPQLVSAVGMPDGTTGSGIVRLAYVLPNGYRYSFRFDSPTRQGDWYSEVVTVISIRDADGNDLSEEHVVAFQWTVRLFYLGVAAVLSVVLVLLIKIPNKIRKRKALPQTD